MIRVLALCGGIGGAKLALGLQAVLPPGELAILCNTGDDFEHLGLSISPDIDTLTYTLAGLADPERGWGRANETWHFMAETRRLGGPDWFALGDRDLALHVERTRRLQAGETLSAITISIAQRLGINTTILPMTDDRLRTRVITAGGELEFQEYFVRQRCAPSVCGFRFAGADDAQPASSALQLLRSDQLRAVIVCPSNPWLSIDPMLAMPALHAALAACKAPVVAVSPIIGGAAVKGPTGKIAQELGLRCNGLTVAQHYAPLLRAFVLDETEAALAPQIGVRTLCCNTLMRTLADKQQLAARVLEFAG